MRGAISNNGQNNNSNSGNTPTTLKGITHMLYQGPALNRQHDRPQTPIYGE
jgi:hypothetical protein